MVQVDLLQLLEILPLQLLHSLIDGERTDGFVIVVALFRSDGLWCGCRRGIEIGIRIVFKRIDASHASWMFSSLHGDCFSLVESNRIESQSQSSRRNTTIVVKNSILVTKISWIELWSFLAKILVESYCDECNGSVTMIEKEAKSEIERSGYRLSVSFFRLDLKNAIQP